MSCSSGDGQAAGFVLAGGRSSRMGTDKALVELGGRPLIAWALDIFRQARLLATIAGARSALSMFAPVIDDPGGGPLHGVCAALEPMGAEYGVFLSVDMPLVPASLIGYLLAHARMTESVAVVASVNGFAQTFPAVVHKSALPMLRSELEAGNDGCFSAIRTAAVRLNRHCAVLAVENLVQAGQVEHSASLPAAFWFLNVNTPADLARAEAAIA